MKNLTYSELVQKQQKEMSEFPIAYAFNEEQLKEALTKLGATKNECTTLGYGTVIKTTDIPAFNVLMERHRIELYEALKDDEFAEEAFLCEMDNHEYAINWSGDEDVLSCFNLSPDELKKRKLEDAYCRARNKHMKHAEEWGMI